MFSDFIEPRLFGGTPVMPSNYLPPFYCALQLW